MKSLVYGRDWWVHIGRAESQIFTFMESIAIFSLECETEQHLCGIANYTIHNNIIENKRNRHKNRRTKIWLAIFCSYHFHQNEIGVQVTTQCFTDTKLEKSLRTKIKQRQNEKRKRKMHTQQNIYWTFVYGNARSFETWKTLFFLYERFNEKLSSKKHKMKENF